VINGLEPELIAQEILNHIVTLIRAHTPYLSKTGVEIVLIIENKNQTQTAAVWKEIYKECTEQKDKYSSSFALQSFLSPSAGVRIHPSHSGAGGQHNVLAGIKNLLDVIRVYHDPYQVLNAPSSAAATAATLSPICTLGEIEVLETLKVLPKWTCDTKVAGVITHVKHKNYGFARAQAAIRNHCVAFHPRFFCSSLSQQRQYTADAMITKICEQLRDIQCEIIGLVKPDGRSGPAADRPQNYKYGKAVQTNFKDDFAVSLALGLYCEWQCNLMDLARYALQ
jgi:hypothetical protein